MAAKVAPHVNLAISAATSGGVITVSSTTDIWPGQVGFVSKSATPSLRVEVLEVLTTTTFRTKLQPKIDDDNFAKGYTLHPAGYSSGNASWDVSAYNGGFFSAEEQVVETQPDGTKPASRL